MVSVSPTAHIANQGAFIEALKKLANVPQQLSVDRKGNIVTASFFEKLFPSSDLALANRRFVELHLMLAIAYGKKWIVPSNIIIIHDLAKKAGLDSKNEGSVKNHQEFKLLLDQFTKLNEKYDASLELCEAFATHYAKVLSPYHRQSQEMIQAFANFFKTENEKNKMTFASPEKEADLKDESFSSTKDDSGAFTAVDGKEKEVEKGAEESNTPVVITFKESKTLTVEDLPHVNISTSEEVKVSEEANQQLPSEDNKDPQGILLPNEEPIIAEVVPPKEKEVAIFQKASESSNKNFKLMVGVIGTLASVILGAIAYRNNYFSSNFWLPNPLLPAKIDPLPESMKPEFVSPTSWPPARMDRLPQSMKTNPHFCLDYISFPNRVKVPIDQKNNMINFNVGNSSPSGFSLETKPEDQAPPLVIKAEETSTVEMKVEAKLDDIRVVIKLEQTTAAIKEDETLSVNQDLASETKPITHSDKNINETDASTEQQISLKPELNSSPKEEFIKICEKYLKNSSSPAQGLEAKRQQNREKFIITHWNKIINNYINVHGEDIETTGKYKDQLIKLANEYNTKYPDEKITIN